MLSMPLVLEQGWVGRRVVVRRIIGLNDEGRPSFADIVGDLVGLSAETAVIESRTGIVEVPVSHVPVARIVEPSSADILALESICARGWRAAESAELGGWLLRANAGFTGRANSVLPLRPPGRPLADALAEARAWYAERGLPLRLQLPLQARSLLDGELGELGFDFSPDVHVLAGRIDLLLMRGGRADAQLDTAPDDDWLARYHYRGATVPQTVRPTLTRHDQVRFASVRRGGAVLAIGRGAVDDGWLGIFAVEVDPEHQRQGLGSMIMRSLWQWALQEYDARRGYLQVRSGDIAAQDFYAALGYWHHHDYRYRQPRDDAVGPAQT
jgi:GNAT superfamily N-acetyltransferase